MAEYCVNKHGDHEVHRVTECSHLPEKENRESFYANSDPEAMKKAKEFFPSVDGCMYCMHAYHHL